MFVQEVMAVGGESRPGGRTERNSRAIFQAVLDLIASVGLDFTFQDVADRSKVSRRTLHRRWPDRLTLISDALASRYREFRVPLTGVFETDLREFAYRFRDFCQSPYEIAINGLAAISADPGFAHISRQSWERVETAMAAIVDNARAHENLPDEVDGDTLFAMLTSPLLVHSSILRRRPSDREVESLVDHVLRAAGHRSAAPGSDRERP